ncbi:centrosomal protein of 89 kDa isoform X2 [Thalassophryne amazonica]|uniref:centrosomal protein of 89 kDa isoform X2 n=1 Tax=Thalassophryne amazonica TaxID=390379 RepID=UPI001471ABBC|nr:centrosomal protein of 89 kDa isoform X2 [Thalassophryne amazonica]
MFFLIKGGTMFKFSFRRNKDKEFTRIAHGFIPAASIAPKPAVPRTPPPRSPNPSPERHRSALAAAILSSSLTGQPWAIPPTRPWSFSETDRSDSFLSGPNICPPLHTRDRWSDDLSSQLHLACADESEEELEEKEKDGDEKEDDGEEHVYQSLDRQITSSAPEPVYAFPLKLKTSIPHLTAMSEGRVPSPELPEETFVQSPKASCESSKKKSSVPSTVPSQATSHPRPPRKHELPIRPSPEANKTQDNHSALVQALPQKNTKTVEQTRLLEEGLQHLDQKIHHSQSSSNRIVSPGAQAELQMLRQQAQELVDENDALKMTVHRLNVELSRYQTRFRPLSKQEVDIKYFSPLLLAYEDRMSEKDALLQATEEEVKRLRVQLEKVITESKRLHGEIDKTGGGVNQKDCHELHQQAILVLQENQALTDQLSAQQVQDKAKDLQHQSEVSKVTKQLMLLEVEKQRMQGEIEESSRKMQKSLMEVQALQTRLKDVITWDEHCNITDKLKCQLEQQEIAKRKETEELLLRVSSLQEESRHLAAEKANLSAHITRLETELELSRVENRKAERRLSELKRQKEVCALKEENTRHYLSEVVSVAEYISQERDQLLHMAATLQQDKQRFIGQLLKGTVRLGKLQEEVKVYRSQASSRLAALEEATEGRTASYQREILHLQRLLRERQEAEERLLQSKREVEEELEVVWQAAVRENQQMREIILDLRPSRDFHKWPSQAPDGSKQHQPNGSGPPLITSEHCLLSPDLHKRYTAKSDPDQKSDSSDEKYKHGLDFYC